MTAKPEFVQWHAANGLGEKLAELPVQERAPAAAFLAAHPPAAGASVAVVIPAYNEGPTVAAVITAIPDVIAGQAAEVIIVDDGSDDHTAAQATAAGGLVCKASHRGQGLALKLGYWLARARGARVIATIDADGQYEPSELERLVAPILDGQADFTNGSRRLGLELTTDPVRRTGVIVFAALVSVLVGQRITDPACGIRAFRAQVTEAVTLEQTQYQTSELLIGAAMRGFRVVEVATTMRDRPEGATETKKGPNLLYGLRFTRAILTTWRRERRAARTRLRSENTQYS